MAYMNQEKKAKIAAALKVALKGENIKYSLSVRNHMVICFTLRAGPKEFQPANGEYSQVNPYHLDSRFSGKELVLLKKINDCLNLDNHDNSDTMSDYFDVGHYVDINIGAYDKPYIVL